LERLRALEEQHEPPRAHPNPPRGGAPGGGSPGGIQNAQLSAAEGRAIGDKLHDCWELAPGDRADLPSAVHITITTDATGVIRDARISAQDVALAGSGRGRYFAEQARRATLEARCSPLPLPPRLLGSNQNFEITFRP